MNTSENYERLKLAKNSYNKFGEVMRRKTKKEFSSWLVLQDRKYFPPLADDNQMRKISNSEFGKNNCGF